MPTNEGERRWAGAWSAGTRPGLLLLLKQTATGVSDGRGIQTGSDRPRIRRLPYTHDPVHADVPHEVTVIKGRRFPTCRHCKGITFELVHAAKHVSEVPHLHQEASPQDALIGTA